MSTESQLEFWTDVVIQVRFSRSKAKKRGSEIYHIPPTKGIIYGLFSDDEPTVIRYVGKTIYEPEVRLRSHLRIKRGGEYGNWIRAVLSRGGSIGMRVIGVYPLDQLGKAERRWMQHYNAINPLLNGYLPMAARITRAHRTG